jgi:hypothetical protein
MPYLGGDARLGESNVNRAMRVVMECIKAVRYNTSYGPFKVRRLEEKFALQEVRMKTVDDCAACDEAA